MHSDFFFIQSFNKRNKFLCEMEKSKEHECGLFHKKKYSRIVFTNKRNEINVLLQGWSCKPLQNRIYVKLKIPQLITVEWI